MIKYFLMPDFPTDVARRKNKLGIASILNENSE
jgi:hypothetical protein